MLEARCVTYRCAEKSLVRDVSLRLEPGRLHALLGPNGAGKSTLVKLMSGQLRPSSGDVLLAGRPLDQFTPQQLALQRALLAQNRAVGFPFSAFDVVLMGRHPHVTLSGETEHDRAEAERCLAETDSGHLAARIYNTLSGGEAARVDLARVLAQDTEVLLLDEPTNHLDPRHQVAVLKLCKQLTAAGRAVVVCMHDLNLAAQFADHILMMKDGAAVVDGAPRDVLTAELLHAVYEIPFAIWEKPGGGICILPDANEATENLCVATSGT
jgi:iron complex transport system ATP-binding protein